MFDLSPLGKTMILAGAILIVLGVLFAFGAKLPWLGRLPGDVYIQKKNFTIIFPVTTSILISLVVSFIIFLLNRR